MPHADVRFDHTIVAAKDKHAAAEFFTDVFGLPEPVESGFFVAVFLSDGRVLDFAEPPVEFPGQHYAFRVTDDTCDHVMERIHARDVSLALEPGETVEDARKAFEYAVADAAARDPWLREHPVRVTWPGGVFASGQLPDGHALLGRVAEAVPTLQYGPGRVEQAHAVDEFVELADVLACARVYALLAARACSVP